MKKRVLVTGATGFVGRGIAEHFARDWQVSGAGRKAEGFPVGSYHAVDLVQGPDAARLLLEEIRPDAVIHCAGTKDVRWCEANPAAAEKINGTATQWMAEAAAVAGAKFVYLSTDLVFPCDRGGYREADNPDPKLVYGKTKLSGEKFALASSETAAICRTSGVFGKNSPVLGWLEKELRSGKGVDAFADVINTPTYLPDLGRMIERILAKNLFGIFHLCGSEAVSRLEWFKAFAAANDFDISQIRSSLAGGRFEELLLSPNSSLVGEATYAAIGLRPRVLSRAFAEMKGA